MSVYACIYIKNQEYTHAPVYMMSINLGHVRRQAIAWTNVVQLSAGL